MKTTKKLLAVFVGFLLVFAVAFTAACTTKEETLQSIKLDTSGVKTEYTIGEEFTSSGLVVTAEVLVNEEAELRTVTDSATVDSSKFDNKQEGTYQIKVSYTLGSVTKDATYNVTVVAVKTLQAIELDLTEAKTVYYVGEAFTADGIKIVATFVEGGTTTTENLTASSSGIYVDYRLFNSSAKADSQKIVVSYTYGSVYKEASYTISVVEEREGVDLVLKEGVIGDISLNEDKTSGSINLSADLKTVTIDPTKIEVRKPDTDGIVDYDSEPLESDEYTVEVYKSGKENALSEYSGLGQGVYEIWVYLPEQDDGYISKNFALIFVNDNLSDIEFISEGSTVKQISGTDEITPTWTYKAKYVSGNEKILTADDVIVEIDTKTVGENQVATVTYTEANSEGTVFSKTINVGYTIEAVPVDPVPVANTIKVNISELVNDGTLTVTTYSTETELGDGITVTASESSTVAVDANKKTITVGEETIDLTHRLKLGGKGSASARSLKIETTGAATITVYMMSSSSGDTNHRTVGIYDNAYTIIGEGQDVTGDNLMAYTYTVDAAGTYYIGSASGGLNIYYVIVDVAAAAETKTATVNISELVNDGTLTVTTYSTETELGDGITVTASEGSTVAVDANKKTITVGEETIELTHRLKLGGKGSASARSLKIETTGAATITVYMMSSSSGDTNHRTVGIYDNAYTIIGEEQDVTGDNLIAYTYTVDAAGTYYIGSASGGLNIYYVIVEQ